MQLCPAPFLICRVELKDASLRDARREKEGFLICRVELKVEEEEKDQGNSSSNRFLICRVELKVGNSVYSKARSVVCS